jgi:hypothetical protein
MSGLGCVLLRNIYEHITKLTPNQHRIVFIIIVIVIAIGVIIIIVVVVVVVVISVASWHQF